jgi:predicted nucleic acid-binding protein
LIVVDASVAMKWAMPEADHETAKSLLSSGVSLVAPAVLRLEVTAGLVRLFRQELLAETRAYAACEEFERLVADGLLTLIPDDQLWEAATKLAFKTRHAFADCLYLVAGKATNAQVVTADVNMAARGSKAGVRTALLTKYVRT